MQSRAALPRPRASTRCSDGRVEVADVDREHGHEAVAGQRRAPLPQALLVDRRQAPLGAGVVDVPTDQLELGIEVELDAGERLEPVPRHPAHLVHRVRVAALPPAGLRSGCSGPVGGGAEVVNPSSPADRAARARRAQRPGDPFGRRRVDRHHDVVRGQPGAVGQHHLHPRAQVRGSCRRSRRAAPGGPPRPGRSRRRGSTRWRYQWSNHASVVGPLSTPSALPEQHRAFESRFGISVLEAMGLTECASVAFANPLEAACAQDRLAGLPLGVEARVVGTRRRRRSPSASAARSSSAAAT